MSPRLLPQLAALVAPGLSPLTYRPRAAALLRAATGCDVVTFAQLSLPSRELAIHFDPLVPGLEAGLPGFGRHMAAYPCFNFDPAVNDGRPFLRGDYLSDEEFYAAPIYTEGFALAGITDHAAILVESGSTGVFFLGLELLGGVFRAEQRDTMTELQPLLVNAWLLAREQAELESATADPATFEQAGLSPRQAAVLRWLCEGKTNAEIAAVLGLKEATVKAYLAEVFDRLGVDNRHAALVAAHRLARTRAAAAAPTRGPGAGDLAVHAAPPPTDQSR